MCWDLKAVFYTIWGPLTFLMGYSDPRKPTNDLLHGAPPAELENTRRPDNGMQRHVVMVTSHMCHGCPAAAWPCSCVLQWGI